MTREDIDIFCWVCVIILALCFQLQIGHLEDDVVVLRSQQVNRAEMIELEYRQAQYEKSIEAQFRDVSVRLNGDEMALKMIQVNEGDEVTNGQMTLFSNGLNDILENFDARIDSLEQEKKLKNL